MYLLSTLLAVTAAGTMAVSPAAAWTPERHPRLQTHRAPGPIAVDGRLDDSGWQGLPRAGNFVEHSPGDQVQPPVATEAMLTYDDDYLYAAFICTDDPATVRASFSERDRIWNDDYVILALDTFGDQAWAFEIACNPYGIQGDILWSNGRGEDISYDMVFYSAGRITADGWQVEMAIPWTSLRFPDRPQQTWRVDFWRNHHRNVRGQYSWGIYDRNEDCWPCQWGTVTGIEGVSPGTGLELLPAMVATQSSRRVTEDDSGQGTWENGKLKAEPSFGAAYGITPSITAEVTLNPDFSQVESDAAQIDVNSTFALFYPERRPFFQEGSDLWSTNYNVIYTRSLNRPLFAAKLTGRPGRTNFATLVAQDDASPYILPFAESSAIIADGGRSWSFLSRVRHTLGEGSHVGVISTARWHEGGGFGAVEGADARIRLDPQTRIELQALVSTTAEPIDPGLSTRAGLNGATFDEGRHTAAFDGESFTGHGLYASLERSTRSWALDLDYWQRSPTFRAENGFEPRNDQRLVTGWTRYTVRADEGLLEQLNSTFNFGRMWDFTGTRKDEWINGNLSTGLRWSQASFSLNHLQSNELFRDILFEDIFSSQVSFDLRPSEMFVGGASVSYGHRIARHDLVMGRETRWNAWFHLRPWTRLRVENSLDHVRSDDLASGRRLFAGYVVRSRLNLQLSREWSLRLILQYDDFACAWDADPLITFRLNPFSIFYVGSTRRLADFTDSGLPDDGWRLAARTYFLKLQYLWQL